VTASPLSKIERSVPIRAPRSRVWSALADIRHFCQWFRAEPADPGAVFQPGAHVRLISTYEGPCYKEEFFVDIVDMVPERTLSWRWHPGVKMPGEDLSEEPMTLVEFRLEDTAGATLVTVTESGFERLFANRRARVFEENEGGWKSQMASLERYFSEPQ
jgi:uncharacterized protein YndB with AHSA1/START domain